jgi:hypothetical protein
MLAFGVSVSSLTISILSFARDRSRIRAWSEILWQRVGEEEIPQMRVYISNSGRRSIHILNLVKISGKSKWWRSINSPEVEGGLITSIEQIEEIKEKWLAHNVSVKLGEGEIIELSFKPSDSHEFWSLHEESPMLATKLYIEDVLKRKYPVRGASKCIDTLSKAWK